VKKRNVEVRIAKFRPDPKKSLANFIEFWGCSPTGRDLVSRSRTVLDKPAIVRADTDLLARTGASAEGFVRLYSDSFIADFEALEMRALAWLEEQI